MIKRRRTTKKKTKVPVGAVEPSAPAAPPQPVAPLGIPCPNCGCCHYLVVYKEAHPGEFRRRRECRHCGRRITTFEHL